MLDYLTGVMCAIIDRKLSSRVGFKSIFKKVLIFCLVGVGHALDTQVIGTGSILRTAVIFFYLSNEGVSLIENTAYLGTSTFELTNCFSSQLCGCSLCRYFFHALSSISCRELILRDLWFIIIVNRKL